MLKQLKATMLKGPINYNFPYMLKLRSVSVYQKDSIV